MTDDRMALVELVQKSGDSDFLRAVAEGVLQILMEADVEGLAPIPFTLAGKDCRLPV